jgi:hypothetical protein
VVVQALDVIEDVGPSTRDVQVEASVDALGTRFDLDAEVEPTPSPVRICVISVTHLAFRLGRVEVPLQAAYGRRSAGRRSAGVATDGAGDPP